MRTEKEYKKLERRARALEDALLCLLLDCGAKEPVVNLIFATTDYRITNAMKAKKIREAYNGA